MKHLVTGICCLALPVLSSGCDQFAPSNESTEPSAKQPQAVEQGAVEKSRPYLAEAFVVDLGGTRLVDSPYLVSSTPDYFEITSSGSSPTVGRDEFVEVREGQTYVVKVKLERLGASRDEAVQPVITAWSFDAEKTPLDQNWSVRFYDNDYVVVGEEVNLTAKFSLEAGDGIRAFANPDDVRYARFTITPDRGAQNDETARIYSFEVTEQSAE